MVSEYEKTVLRTIVICVAPVNHYIFFNMNYILTYYDNSTLWGVCNKFLM